MNWLQKGLIALVVGLFLFNHRTVIVNQYRENTPVLTSEEITDLENKVDLSYRMAKEKITAGTYTPLDWQRDVYFWQVKILRQMGGLYSEERFFVLAGQAHEYAYKNYYWSKDQRDDPLFQSSVNQAQAQVMVEKGERTNWGRIIGDLHSIMLAFLPYSFLIILVRRSTRYRLWQIFSVGDVVCILFYVGFSIFGAIAYQPDNFLQKRIDSQLQTWKRKIGAHGWRLALAYLVAIVVSLATLIRPAKSQTQVVVETKVVSLVRAANAPASQQEEPDERLIFYTEKVIGFLRRFFEEIMRGFEAIIFGFFSLVITQIFSPPLEFVWGLWARPPDEIRFWTTRALGSRAPADFVLANSLKT